MSRPRAWIAVSAILFATGLAQAQRQPATPLSSNEVSVRKFLQSDLRISNLDNDKTARYFAAFVDLNGDGKQEAIVYVMGEALCGSGGCRTLILARHGTSWTVVKHITITRPPIRVLSSTSHGWHSISVWVQGGGIQPGYEAELSFDGKTYPGNPSVPPARRLNATVPGEVVIPSIEGGTPIYP